jgi:hypothetical protein
MQLDLPSGLIGDVRKIKGVEIAQMAESAAGGGLADGGFTSLLGACWDATVDPGPYVFAQAGAVKPDFKRVLKGDLLAGIIFLRRVSLTDGDSFDFDARCEECGKKIQWTKRLSELEFKKLPKDSVARMKASEPFETSAGGLRVFFNLQTLAQEEPIQRLMKQQKRQKSTIVDTLCSQVVRIDGLKDPKNIKQQWRFLSELSMGELYDLQAAMAEPDCGVDTAIEVRCQNVDCLWEQEVNLPLLSRRFFAPRKRPRPEIQMATEESEDGSGETSSEESASNGGANAAPTSGGINTGAAATG